MARLPAPIAVVYLPGRWIARRALVRRTATKAAGKEMKRVEAAVTERLTALGHTGMAEPLTVEVATIPTTDAPTQALTDLRSLAYRHRRDVLAPVAVALVLTALRFVMRWPAYGWSWTSLGFIAVPILSVAVAGIWWSWQIDRESKGGPGRWAAVMLTTLAGIIWLASPGRIPLPVWPHEMTAVPWMAFLHLMAPGATMPGARWAILIAATLTACLERHRRFKPRAYVAPRATGNADRWNTVIAEKGSLADFLADPNSEHRIIDEAGKDVGWEFRVDAPANTEGGIAVAGARNKIATTYRVRPEWIEFTQTDSLASCLVKVVESATLATSVAWQPGGVDIAAGTVEMGNFPDGTRSKIQAWSPGRGAKHAWFTGSTGSGKTGSVSCYLGRVMQTGMVVLDLVDLGETSLPSWVPKAFRFGTSAEDGLMALRRAIAVMEARQAAMRVEEWTDRDGIERVGRSTLTPDEEWPLWCLTIEEWPELLAYPEAVQHADRLGRLGRKYGIQLVLISQACTLKEAFGNAGVLRTNIQKGGNVVCLANEKDAARMALGGIVNVDPSAIPLDTPGLGFIVGPANYRDVMARGDWIDDDEDRPAHVPSSWQVASYAVPGTPNPIDLAAVEKCEADYAAPEVAAEGEPVKPTALVTRHLVEATIRKLATDEPATLGAVVAELGDPEDTSHYDRVRNLCKQLAKDPASTVNQPKWGCYAA